MSLRRELLALFLFGAAACDSEAESPQQNTRVGSLDWELCGNVECASVRVPIDYDDPGAGTLPIAVNRVRANPDGAYHGMLLINPGGPGGPGKPFVAGSAGALRTLFPGFDFIGFDPRGVGDSAQLGCEVNLDTEREYREGGVAGLVSAFRQQRDRCAQQTGALFEHLGSNQVVADIEQIRVALGVEQISFFGVSYGTRLGALYAQTYPERIRALVLDSPFAPRADLTEETEQQFTALLDAQASFFEACADATLSCPADAEATFAALLEAAREMGVVGAFLNRWKQALATPPGREQLALLLRNVEQEARGEMPTQLAMPQNFVPVINVAANLTTNCADDINPPPTLAEGAALMASYQQRSAIFAAQGLSALTCAGWEVAPDPVPALGFAPSIPVLVVGGVEDSLTPLSWAEETAQLIVGSRLLQSEHYGHGAIVFGGPCVFDYLRDYLADLEPVPEGARCPPP